MWGWRPCASASTTRPRSSGCSPDGTFGAYALRSATLTAPNAASTGFSASVVLPAGSYGLSARATDVGGTADSTDAWVVFTVA